MTGQPAAQGGALSITAESQQQRRGRRLSDGQVGFLLVLPALVLFVIVILYPLLTSMYMGFLDKSLVYPGEEFVGLKNIERVMRREFGPLLITTVLFTLGATILPFIVGFAVALLLNAKIPGRGFMRGMFLLPWLIPAVVVSFLWMWIFNANYGVLNGILRESGLITQNINFLGNRSTSHVDGDYRQNMEHFPVDRHHDAGWPANHPSGTVRGSRH